MDRELKTLEEVNGFVVETAEDALNVILTKVCTLKPSQRGFICARIVNTVFMSWFNLTIQVGNQEENQRRKELIKSE